MRAPDGLRSRDLCLFVSGTKALLYQVTRGHRSELPGLGGSRPVGDKKLGAHDHDEPVIEAEWLQEFTLFQIFDPSFSFSAFILGVADGLTSLRRAK